ncbi:MAG: hypothetical protein DCO98_11540 [Altererythrobacter sp. XM-24bin4]|nr:MAG: hypothetical protein DCO81_06660 [Candidatus Aquiluna sp. XM-24bin5]PWL24156.1 MAG: hypothetical protein DCO98_11540 [Altererythrobacter sp. XM-24bin4]
MITRIFPIIRLYFVRLASVLLSLGFSILAARLLGVGNFGDYVALMAVVGLFTVVAGAGLPQLLERETAAARGSGSNERLAIVLQWIALLGSVSILILSIIWLAFGQAGLVVFLVILTGMGAAFASAVLNGIERVEISAVIIGILRPALALVFLVLTTLTMGPLWVSALTAQILASAVTSAVALWLIWRVKVEVIHHAVQAAFSLRPGPTHRIVALAGFNFALIQVLINATQQAEILWLSVLASPEDVAHFFAASRAGNGVSLLHASVLAIYTPRIIRLHAAGEILARDHEVLQATRVSFIATLLVAVIAATVSGPYLHLYGESFKEAQIPMIIILFGWVVVSALGPVVALMITLGRERDVWIGVTLGLGGGALTAWALIPTLGTLGAALSFLLMIVLAHIYLLPILRRNLGYILFCAAKI